MIRDTANEVCERQVDEDQRHRCRRCTAVQRGAPGAGVRGAPRQRSALRQRPGLADVDRNALAAGRPAPGIQPRSRRLPRVCPGGRQAAGTQHRQCKDASGGGVAGAGRRAHRGERRSVGQRPLAAQHAGRHRRAEERQAAATRARRLHYQDHGGDAGPGLPDAAVVGVSRLRDRRRRKSCKRSCSGRAATR